MPRPLTSFIDRTAEIAALEALLARDDARLVTLTGPGGVGKTRIAVALALRHRDRGEPVVFVPLAAVRDPSFVFSAIAQRIGSHVGMGASTAEQMSNVLGDKRLLLVLDNVEQVLDAGPEFARLLELCPSLTMLVTSQVRLGLAGEQSFPISPLPIPGEKQDQGPTYLGEIGAIRLFVERAQAAQPDFTLTEANAGAVADICRRLDGLPLAIELAAARMRMLTPAELRTRLEQRLPLLTGGGRDLPERQRTIRATIAWSYGQLTPAEQRFFRQMAVFAGGFTWEIAEATDVAGSEPDALTGIAALIDHSLVRLQPGDGETRYIMLETVREFGLEQLAASGEEEAARTAHARALLALAQRMMPDVTQHPTYEAVTQLNGEIGNVRSALTWLAQTGRTTELADLVLQLRWLWYLSYVAEGLRWYDLLLSSPAIASHPALATLMREAGQLAITLTPTSAQGIAWLDRARALAHASGDVTAEAETAALLGIAAEDAGEPAAAEQALRAARALWQQLGDVTDIALVDYHLGIIAYGRGDLTAAEDLLTQASIAATSTGDRMIPTWCSWYLALAACDEHEPARAVAAFATYHHEAARALRQSVHWATHFAVGAVLAATVGDDLIAARLFGAVVAESKHDPLGWPERVTVERVAAAVRARLGDDVDDAARRAGASLSAAEVVAEIDRLLDLPATAPPERTASALPITQRELEILQLIIEGKSNLQIADELFISPRTVSTHVTNILAKLDVDSRTAAVAYALRAGLA